MQTKPFRSWVYFFWPVIFTSVCWLIWLYDSQYGIDDKLGVRPREIRGLFGILTHPFLHQDFNHLLSNTTPLLFLGSSLFYFYKRLPYRVIFWLFIGGGAWLWCFGRAGNHIGASGLVYGLFAFLFFGGVVSKNKRLMAISLLTVFIYGSMIWGIFPLKEGVSWEGHLTSLCWGIILAFFYKKYIPKEIKYPLTDENSKNEAIFGTNYWKTEDQVTMESQSKDDIHAQISSNTTRTTKTNWHIVYTYKEEGQEKKDL